MSVRTVGIGTLFLAGISFGALSLAIARREAAFAFAGELPTRAAAELIAGWSLLAVGLVACARRRGRTFGPLLVCASFGWFLLEWNNPGIGSALGFAIGLKALRRRPAADRARGAHLPPIASFLAARRSRAHRRVCGRDRRARASTGSVLRPEGNRLYSMPEQPAPRWAVTPSLRRVQPDRRSRRTRMVACPRRILRPTSRPAGGFGLTIRFRVDPRSRGRPPNAVLVMHR